MPGVLGSVTAILTSACTLRCAYCYQRPGGSLRMSWPVLRAALDLLGASRNGRPTIEFSGGEPMLAFPLVRRAVRYVEACPWGSSARFVLTTNGTRLDEASLRFFDRHRFQLRLSFHATPPVGNRARGVFHRLDRLLDQLRAHHAALWRSRLSVAVTVGAGELPALADTVEYLAGKGVRRIGLAAAYGQASGWRAGTAAEMERQFARISRLMRAHRARTGRVPLALYQGHGGAAQRADLRCSGATGHAVVVEPAGQTYGCVLLAGARAALAGDSARRSGGLKPALVLPASSPLWAFRMGDVRSADFAERLSAAVAAIEQSGIFTERRTQHSRHGRCGECRYLGRCSICPAARAFDPHPWDECAVSDFVCAFNRVAFAHADRFAPVPTVWDQLAGRARAPILVRQLRQAARALRQSDTALDGRLAL